MLGFCLYFVFVIVPLGRKKDRLIYLSFYYSNPRDNFPTLYNGKENDEQFLFQFRIWIDLIQLH